MNRRNKKKKKKYASFLGGRNYATNDVFCEKFRVREMNIEKSLLYGNFTNELKHVYAMAKKRILHRIFRDT